MIRPPAVAGVFYPAEAEPLGALVARCFATSVEPLPGAGVPAALVVPHAGLVYSGPIAASAYRRLEPSRSTIHRVVLLGPSHRVPLRGIALSGAESWMMPFGPVPVDTGAMDELSDLPFVTVDDGAHADEHSLEVQLPFLQSVLDDFELVPLVVGDATPSDVASVIDRVWSAPHTLIVVSTDLSHYHRYADAVALDSRTAADIAAKRPERIGDTDACGSRPLRGLLRSASDRDLPVERIDLRNSGDTAGDRQRVVGYGAFAIG